MADCGAEEEKGEYSNRQGERSSQHHDSFRPASQFTFFNVAYLSMYLANNGKEQTFDYSIYTSVGKIYTRHRLYH